MSQPQFNTDFKKFLAYNVQDVLAESAVSENVPPLTDAELEVWRCDQRVNNRGIGVNVRGIYDCIAIVEQCFTRYSAELGTLTEGAVQTVSQTKKLLEWLTAQAHALPNLQAETIEMAIKDHEVDALGCSLPPKVYRVLQLRQLLASASVKKLYSMKYREYEGRMHGLYAYHAARTGRWTAMGPQPQNFPKPLPEFEDFEEVLKALKIISRRSLDELEAAYPAVNALDVIGSCLRSLLIAGPGNDLICSDFVSIEAVVLACLAGEQWRIDTFRSGQGIYEVAGSRLDRIPLEEIIAYKKIHGKHHPRRAAWKIAELACFAPDTQVLTNRGYVSIVDVSLEDLVWDGNEWVRHRGPIYRGMRAVTNLDGIEVTPDHKILCGSSWLEASRIVLNESTLYLALETGSENLPSWTSKSGAKGKVISRFHVAAERFMRSCSRIYDQGKVLVAIGARASKARLSGLIPFTKNLPPSCLMQGIAGDSSTGCERRSPDAPPRTTLSGKTMVAEGYESVTNGSLIKGFSSSMSKLLKDGITPLLTWTGLTRTATTNRAISVSSRGEKTSPTGERFPYSNGVSPSLKPVYDLVDAGPRNRFTIKTASGHLVVHNCGYGGWIGAMRNFGATEPDAELKEQILAWRRASSNIVEFWGGQTRNKFNRNILGHWEKCRAELFGLEGAAVAAVQQPGRPFWVGQIAYQYDGKILYCRLPSGRFLAYHNPQLRQSAGQWSDPWELHLTFEGWNSNSKKGPIGWIRMSLYGGLLCENVVQAVARDYQANALLALEAAGYPPVLHSHDEIASEVSRGFGSIEEFESIGSRAPSWAVLADGTRWPVRMNGGWRGVEYHK